DGMLTCKVDGSLLLLNVYMPGSEQHVAMTELLALRRSALYATLPDGGLVVPATQGTLFISKEMTDFLVTALWAACGMDAPLPAAKCPVADAWAMLQSAFVPWAQRLVTRLVETRPDAPMYNFAFEMVCANRTSYA